VKKTVPRVARIARPPGQNRVKRTPSVASADDPGGAQSKAAQVAPSGDPDENELSAILQGSDPSLKKIPVGLSRDAIRRGMSRVADRVKQCADKQSEPVYVTVTIAKSGSVSKAVATGAFAGTSVGRCVARAVLSASFPPSLKETTVKYPFYM
jgi:hypothetical protein